MNFIYSFTRSLTCILFTCLVLVAGIGRTAAAEQPNIILIFADDLGWQEPGYAGSDFCETPNLDRLASEGMVFRHAYASAGYATGMFGKCHLTDTSAGKSERRGFDVVKVSQHGLNSSDPNDPKGIFSITDAACEFIETNRKRPFFAYLPHYAVHTKLQGRADTLRRFKAKPPGEKQRNPMYAASKSSLWDLRSRLRERIVQD